MVLSFLFAVLRAVYPLFFPLQLCDVDFKSKLDSAGERAVKYAGAFPTAESCRSCGRSIKFQRSMRKTVCPSKPLWKISINRTKHNERRPYEPAKSKALPVKSAFAGKRIQTAV